MRPVGAVVGMQDGDLDEAQVAHLLHGAPRAQVGGVEPLVVADHEGHARLAHRARDLFRLGQAEGQRLLDEQGLARGEQVEHGVAVAAGGEEEDGFDVLLAGQLAAVLEAGRARRSGRPRRPASSR